MNIVGSGDHFEVEAKSVVEVPTEDNSGDNSGESLRESKRRRLEQEEPQQQQLDDYDDKKHADEEEEDSDEEEELSEPLHLLDSINTLVLPDDVLIHVFFYAFVSSVETPDYVQLVRNKRNYSLVCRHWYNLVNSRPLWVPLLRIVDDRHPVPLSTAALQELVLEYCNEVNHIRVVWDQIADILVTQCGYDNESVTIGDAFAEAEIRELESRWNIKLPLRFIALLRTPRLRPLSG